MGFSWQQHPVFSLCDSSGSMALIPMELWGYILALSANGSLLILPAWRELLLEDHFCGFIIKSTPQSVQHFCKHLIPYWLSLLRLQQQNAIG